MDKTVPNDIFHRGCNKCAYCGVKTGKAKCIRTYPQRTQRFIFYCYAHSVEAERDLVSVLKERGLIRQCDVLQHPLFAVLPEDLVTKNGGSGWFLNKSLMEDSITFVHLRKDGTWVIAIDNITPYIDTYMPVSDLKVSLPDEHHGLVDDFIVWLSNGGSSRRSFFCCLH